MARTLKFSKDKILNVAYNILITEGMKSVTARNIAAKLNSSTISIYSNFGSMTVLKNQLSKVAKNKLFDKVAINYTDLSLLNIGIGICLFAKEEKALFRAIFMRENLSKNFLDELVEELKGLVFKGFKEGSSYNFLEDETIEWMLKKGWWYVHGFACLICSGFYDPTYEMIEHELKENGNVILKEALCFNKSIKINK
ncbi:TetR/AcrR family transcriptional regulator [Fusobacterium sp. IOR10]|uniref:TetR/AcrR family transcriptional regulator n=1 Tax=Fusobacterium sp. IOR10 TaxID=2665157 RepID=UPI0013D5AC8E|nr:TetR/AcrR family transcriptional regulator [Fusobacterium sp. IOR10]